MNNSTVVATVITSPMAPGGAERKQHSGEVSDAQVWRDQRRFRRLPLGMLWRGTRRAGGPPISTVPKPKRWKETEQSMLPRECEMETHSKGAAEVMAFKDPREEREVIRAMLIGDGFEQATILGTPFGAFRTEAM